MAEIKVETRIERDSMGEVEVPAEALYGASTQRAVLNFPISGQRFPRRFIRAQALIKRAAAAVNGELGLLDMDLAAAMAIEEELLPGLERLRTALEAKAGEFMPIVKTGRTHLQDATPIRLGQEFRGYAGQLEESLRRARQAREELLSVPLGGTAVGTGINAHPDFARRAIERLSQLTGLPLRETSNHFHAQA